MGSGGGTTTVQKADPWEKQRPYLAGGRNQFDTLVPGVFPEAAKLYKNGGLAPDYYSGSTVAEQSDWTRQALKMQADRALGGSASIDSAQAGVDGIVAGNAISGNAGLQSLESMAGQDLNAGNAGLQALESMSRAQNPYIDALYRDAAGQAGAAIDSGFSEAGRYGSGAHQNARASAMADMAADMYSAAYDQQLAAASQAANAYANGLDARIAAATGAGQLYADSTAQRLEAAGVAQQLANQAYADSAALSEAGAAQDQYRQALTDAAVDRWNYTVQQPLMALSNYNQLIQGTYGGTTTSIGKSDYTPSALGAAANGALAGGTLAQLMAGDGSLYDWLMSS